MDFTIKEAMDNGTKQYKNMVNRDGGVKDQLQFPRPQLVVHAVYYQ